MNQIEAKSITKNLVYFKENVTQLEKILDKLIEYDCLAMDERENILVSKTTDKQCHKLLDILLKRGGNAYNCLIDALECSGNHHVAMKIRKTETFKDDQRFFPEPRDDTFTVNTMVDFDEDEIIQLCEEREMYQDRVKELEVNCKLLQNENELKNRQIEKLRDEVGGLKKSLETGYDAVDNADTNCAEHTRMMREVEMQCKAFEEENCHLQVVQRSLQETISEKEITIQHLNEEKSFYKQQIDQLRTEIKRLRQENAMKDTKIKLLSEELRKLRTELLNTRRAMDKMGLDSKATMEQMKTDHARRFNQLDNKLDCVMKMLQASKMTDKNSTQNTEATKTAGKQGLPSGKSDNRPDGNLKNKPPQNRGKKNV